MLVEELAQGFSIRADHALYYESTQQKNIMNGWANFETWNVALWIGNEEIFHDIAKDCKSFLNFVDQVEVTWELQGTPDGVSFTDPNLDIDELDEMILEL